MQRERKCIENKNKIEKKKRTVERKEKNGPIART